MNFTTVKDLEAYGFNSAQPEASIDYVFKNNITYISLISNYTHKSLDLLLPLKNKIQGLALNDRVNIDLLDQFEGLKILGGDINPEGKLNLKWFPHLEILGCKPSKNISGLESCQKLRFLTLQNYNPKGQDLNELPVLQSLEKLEIIKTNIQTLSGIERFKRVTEFELYGAPKLLTCSALISLSNGLKIVSFELCKKVEDFEALAKLRKLEKIMLTDSGKIGSLAFVKDLPNLKFISFVGTNVVDGNLFHCSKIEYVGFDNKKHYSHKMRDLM